MFSNQTGNSSVNASLTVVFGSFRLYFASGVTSRLKVWIFLDLLSCCPMVNDMVYDYSVINSRTFNSTGGYYSGVYAYIY